MVIESTKPYKIETDLFTVSLVDEDGKRHLVHFLPKIQCTECHVAYLTEWARSYLWVYERHNKSCVNAHTS